MPVFEPESIMAESDPRQVEYKACSLKYREGEEPRTSKLRLLRFKKRTIGSRDNIRRRRTEKES